MPSRAVAFSDVDGNKLLVSNYLPLPVRTASLAAAAPFSGSASVSAVTGPFVPVSGSPVVLVLSGT